MFRSKRLRSDKTDATHVENFSIGMICLKTFKTPPLFCSQSRKRFRICLPSASHGDESIVAPAMSRIHRVLFALFFASGFCSLLYQVIWLRLAFAHFGIITPVLSVVLSAFMLGLGSWLAGRWVQTAAGSARSPALYYGAAEVVIGTGAWVVPALFVWGERLLRGLGATSSVEYLLLSALVIAGTILGYTVLMGTTFPLMMAFIRHHDPAAASSFSFLYLANVIGAMCGAQLTALIF
jgi:spermidine synthase